MTGDDGVRGALLADDLHYTAMRCMRRLKSTQPKVKNGVCFDMYAGGSNGNGDNNMCVCVILRGDSPLPTSFTLICSFWYRRSSDKQQTIHTQ